MHIDGLWNPWPCSWEMGRMPLMIKWGNKIPEEEYFYKPFVADAGVVLWALGASAPEPRTFFFFFNPRTKFLKVTVWTQLTGSVMSADMLPIRTDMGWLRVTCEKCKYHVNVVEPVTETSMKRHSRHLSCTLLFEGSYDVSHSSILMVEISATWQKINRKAHGMPQSQIAANKRTSSWVMNDSYGMLEQ